MTISTRYTAAPRLLSTLVMFGGLMVVNLPAHAQSIDTADQALQAFRKAGHEQVRDLEWDNGLWEAEVSSVAGFWRDVVLDPRTGKVLDGNSGEPTLARQVIVEKLVSAGYTGVHDLDREGAVWEAEALRRDGQAVDLRLNAHTGAILSEEID